MSRVPAVADAVNFLRRSNNIKLTNQLDVPDVPGRIYKDENIHRDWYPL